MLEIKLKIPPPLYLMIFALLMSWLNYFFPSPHWLSPYSLLLASLLCGVALVIIFWSAGLFFRVKTTVSPLSPNKSCQLVMAGPYRFTRNPMYLSLFLMLIAWALYLGSLSSALLLTLWIPTLNRWQIKPEEHALEQIFGEQYLAYKNTVRRWL